MEIFAVYEKSFSSAEFRYHFTIENLYFFVVLHTKIISKLVKLQELFIPSYTATAKRVTEEPKVMHYV